MAASKNSMELTAQAAGRLLHDVDLPKLIGTRDFWELTTPKLYSFHLFFVVLEI